MALSRVARHRAADRRAISLGDKGSTTAALGDERAAERGTLIAAQLLGLALCRYILRFEPLASLSADDVVAAVAPSVQRYLTRPAASPSARRRRLPSRQPDAPLTSPLAIMGAYRHTHREFHQSAGATSVA